MHYLYRSTTDKLAAHLDSIEQAGDTVAFAPIFMGGRDWLVICLKGRS